MGSKSIPTVVNLKMYSKLKRENIDLDKISAKHLSDKNLYMNIFENVKQTTQYLKKKIGNHFCKTKNSEDWLFTM